MPSFLMYNFLEKPSLAGTRFIFRLPIINKIRIGSESVKEATPVYGKGPHS